jgi:3-oxoacyl-[acyl-carrier protein] reductase
MKRVALITGGSRGIGFGIAKQLAENGFSIAINGVRPIADVKDAIEDLKKTGAEVLYCQGNIASHEDRTRIVKEVKDHYHQASCTGEQCRHCSP